MECRIAWFPRTRVPFAHPESRIPNPVVSRILSKLRRDRGNRPDLDVAVENLRALGLENDRAGRDRCRQVRVDAERAVEAHHHLAIHDVNRIVAERDQFDGVPLARGLLVIGLLDASALRALALREERPLTGRIVVVQNRLRIRPRPGPNGDDRPDRVEIPDVVFLDLQFDGPRPRSAADAWRCMYMIEKPAVARDSGAVSGRPSLRPPLELQLEVIVLERRFGSKLAEHLAGDPNRRPSVDVRRNGEYVQRVPPRPDRLEILAVRRAFQPAHLRRWIGPLHPRRPAIEILAVPQ